MARRIRKSAGALTWEDFDAHPAWEYALDEEGRPDQDETTVRPATLPRTAGAAGPLILAAVFSFPNGRVRFGAAQIGDRDDVSETQPALLLPDGPLHFYGGALVPKPAELKRLSRRLKAISDPPFPIHFVSTLRDRAGAPLVEGVLRGIAVWGGFQRPPKLLRLP